MRDNSDVQQIHKGKVTDMRMESCLSCIFDGRWDEKDLDTLYTEVVSEFLDMELPTLLVSVAGKTPSTAQGLLYLSMLQLDYTLVHRGGDEWPGDFDFFPNAQYAVQLRYKDQNQWTDWVPGVSPSAAGIAALMQYCRELSREMYNSDEEIRLN